MAQLGELKNNEEKFKAAGAEVIAVFREESKGVEGLEIIKKRAGAGFTYALDTGKKKTARYSPGRRKFDNYVIDKSGIIRAVINGDLRNRAKSDELLKTVSGLQKTEPAEDKKKDKQAAKSSKSDKQ